MNRTGERFLNSFIKTTRQWREPVAQKSLLRSAGWALQRLSRPLKRQFRAAAAA
jgi:hypothetical protein